MLGRRHATLRRTTASLHEDLDKVVGSLGYFQTADGYASYIARMHLFHARFEAAMMANGDSVLQDWLGGDCIPWLENDLADLDRAALPAEAGFRMQVPDLSTEAARLGAVYVVIGASLGAKLLLRRTERLRLPGGGSSAYLAGMSRFSGWKAFLDHLENARIELEDDLTLGAVGTFKSVRDHLTEPLRA